MASVSIDTRITASTAREGSSSTKSATRTSPSVFDKRRNNVLATSTPLAVRKVAAGLLIEQGHHVQQPTAELEDGQPVAQQPVTKPETVTDGGGGGDGDNDDDDDGPAGIAAQIDTAPEQEQKEEAGGKGKRKFANFSSFKQLALTATVAISTMNRPRKHNVDDVTQPDLSADFKSRRSSVATDDSSDDSNAANSDADDAAFSGGVSPSKKLTSMTEVANFLVIRARCQRMLRKVDQTRERARKKRLQRIADARAAETKRRWGMVKELAAATVQLTREYNAALDLSSLATLPAYTTLRRILGEAPANRTESDIHTLAEIIKRLKFFKIYNLDVHDRRKLCRHMVLKSYRAGYEDIFRAGEYGNAFYIVVVGGVKIRVEADSTLLHGRPQASSAAHGSGGDKHVLERTDSSASAAMSALKEMVARPSMPRMRVARDVAHLLTGDCFGERALWTKDQLRTATATTTGPTQVLQIPQVDYNEIIRSKQELLLQSKFEFLRDVNAFTHVDDETLRGLCLSMTLAHATVDQPIFKQGDAIDYVSFFTIVRIGEVSVWQDTPAQHREAVGADRVLLHKLGPGSVLARRELFQATERGVYSCTITANTAVELAIISHHDLTSRLEENDIDALVNVLPCAPSRRALDNQCRQLVLWRRFRHKVAGEIRVDNVNSRHTFTNRSSTLIPVTQRKRVTIQDVAAAQRNAVQARPHTGSGETPHYASRMKRDEVTTRELEQLQHEEAKLKAWHNPLVADMVTPKDILRTTMKAVTGFRNLTGAKSKKLQPRVKGPGGSLLGLSFDLGSPIVPAEMAAHVRSTWASGPEWTGGPAKAPKPKPASRRRSAFKTSLKGAANATRLAAGPTVNRRRASTAMAAAERRQSGVSASGRSASVPQFDVPSYLRGTASRRNAIKARTPAARRSMRRSSVAIEKPTISQVFEAALDDQGSVGSVEGDEAGEEGAEVDKKEGEEGGQGSHKVPTRLAQTMSHAKGLHIDVSPQRGSIVDFKDVLSRSTTHTSSSSKRHSSPHIAGAPAKDLLSHHLDTADPKALFGVEPAAFLTSTATGRATVTPARRTRRRSVDMGAGLLYGGDFAPNLPPQDAATMLAEREGVTRTWDGAVTAWRPPTQTPLQLAVTVPTVVLQSPRRARGYDTPRERAEAAPAEADVKWPSPEHLASSRQVQRQRRARGTTSGASSSADSDDEINEAEAERSYISAVHAAGARVPRVQRTGMRSASRKRPSTGSRIAAARAHSRAEKAKLGPPNSARSHGSDSRAPSKRPGTASSWLKPGLRLRAGLSATAAPGQRSGMTWRTRVGARPKSAAAGRRTPREEKLPVEYQRRPVRVTEVKGWKRPPLPLS